jgi:hypothetical protein
MLLLPNRLLPAGLLHLLLVHAALFSPDWWQSIKYSVSWLPVVDLHQLLQPQLRAAAALAMAAGAVLAFLWLFNTCTSINSSSSSSSKGSWHAGRLADSLTPPTKTADGSIFLQAASNNPAAAVGSSGHNACSYHQQQLLGLQQLHHNLGAPHTDSPTSSPAAAAAAAGAGVTAVEAVAREELPAPVVDVWILAGQSNMVGWNKADGQDMPQLCAPWPGEIFAFNSEGKRFGPFWAILNLGFELMVRTCRSCERPGLARSLHSLAKARV